MRWAHFVAGITWIGMLYFFNLINVNFMKSLDAPTKKIVVPNLMPHALWYFRWGALVTVIAGFGYFAMYILRGDVKNANSDGAGANTWLMLLVWLLIAVRRVGALQLRAAAEPHKDGKILAAATAGARHRDGGGARLVARLAVDGHGAGRPDHLGPATRRFSIGIGGALGIIMLLNVWGIIWPAQKRIIAATAAGTRPTPRSRAAPSSPRAPTRGSRSRCSSSWATSHGDCIIFGRNASLDGSETDQEAERAAQVTTDASDVTAPARYCSLYCLHNALQPQ